MTRPKVEHLIRRARRVGLRLLLPLCLASLASATPAPEQKPRLFAYLPTALKPNVLSRLLQDALPAFDVTVFGRINDFRAAVGESPPDVALTLRPVLDDLQLKPALQGVWHTSDAETYVVMSADAAFNVGDPTGKTFGTVDLLGRKKMGAFVASMLGLTGAPKIQSVTKPEDLLPLLQFKSADAVLMPESTLDELKSRTKMELRVTRLPSAHVGRAAVAFLNAPKRAELEPQIVALPKDVIEKFGVDTWQKR